MNINKLLERDDVSEYLVARGKIIETSTCTECGNKVGIINDTVTINILYLASNGVGNLNDLSSKNSNVQHAMASDTCRGSVNMQSICESDKKYKKFVEELTKGTLWQNLNSGRWSFVSEE